MSAFFQSLPSILYSPRFYANLLRRQSGIGFAYIAMALLIDLVGFLFMGWKAVTLLGVLLTGIADQLPEVTITDHKLSIDRPSPYAIKMDIPELDKKKELASEIVIDTQFQNKDLTELNAYMNKNNILMLITADQAVIQEGKDRDLKIYNFLKVTNQVITSEDWHRFNHLIQSWAVPVLTSILVMMRFITNLIKSLIGGLIGVIAGSFTRTVPDFPAGMRLASAAMVPQAPIAAFLPTHGGLSLLVWLGYIVFGAIAAGRYVDSGRPPRPVANDFGI